MIAIRNSSLEEYSKSFWCREAVKNEGGTFACEQIRNGASALELLRRPHLPGDQRSSGHPYKLPSENNSIVRVMALDQGEIENLIIHDYMISATSKDGEWIRQRVGMVNSPKMKDLAEIFLARHYFFDRRWQHDPQVRRYQEWEAKGNLSNVLAGDDMPLIECSGPHEFEIVDGWGRLLPFVALLVRTAPKGLPFAPIELYVATSN